MTTGHQDLLTIDELPIAAEELASQVRGIVLVDHPLPLPAWETATVLGLFDHHADRGSSPDAHPRVFERVASCSTLVGRQMLDELETLPGGEYHVPHELLELLLSAIAIDSGGLQSRITTPTDHFVASRLYKRSNWSNESFYDKMLDVSKTLKTAKNDLDHLSVRDLLRRDWKGKSRLPRTKHELLY
jgi:exopolyphosphatase